MQDYAGFAGLDISTQRLKGSGVFSILIGLDVPVVGLWWTATLERLKFLSLDCHSTVFSCFSSCLFDLRGGQKSPPHFGMWVVLCWRQLRACGLMRNFYLSLKEFKLRALSIKGVITRKTFYDLHVGQDKLLIAVHLHLLYCKWSSSSLKPQVPYPIP